MPHQNPTATQQSYWELGSQDAPLFAGLRDWSTWCTNRALNEPLGVIYTVTK